MPRSVSNITMKIFKSKTRKENSDEKRDAKIDKLFMKEYKKDKKAAMMKLRKERLKNSNLKGKDIGFPELDD